MQYLQQVADVRKDEAVTARMQAWPEPDKRLSNLFRPNLTTG